MKKYDVVIIGAASSGAFFAKRMAEKGYKVKIIEKDTKAKVGSKYDIFHMGAKEFDTYGLPRPVEGDKEWGFEFDTAYSESPTGKYPKKFIDPVVGLHMHEYTVLIDEWAKSYGAEIEYGAEFTDFIYDDGKVAGVKYNTSKGEKELLAKVVVDASGINAVARTKLPDSSTVENRPLADDDMFYVILRYIKFKDKNQFLAGSLNWPSYKSWLAPQPDRNGGILGIGACHGYDTAMKNFEKVDRNIPLLPYDIVRIEKGKTPYTRPPYSFVDDGFIATGDAACLTKPNNGEGVTSSMVQIEIAVRVLDEALQKDDTSKEALWKINRLYNEAQGADFASTRAILTKSVNATDEEFEYFFKHDIIFSEKFLDTASSGPEIPITLQDIIQIGSNGIAGIATGQISLKTLKLLLEGVTLGDKLKKHYLAFPETPKGYDEWVKEADAIWKKVGKMS